MRIAQPYNSERVLLQSCKIILTMLSAKYKILSIACAHKRSSGHVVVM